MTETPRFEPIYPAHAIERCSATVGFGEPITEKLLQKIRTKAGPLFSQLQMGAQVQSQLSFEIDPQSGVATPKQSGFGAIVYSNMDRSLNCIITPMALVWNNARYVRWQPFIGQMEQTIPPLLSIINDAVNITNIKLEYLDRFYWTGDWDNFDSKKLLRSDRGSWAETANRGRREWHSHAGWFETISENSRRLMNINIDAVSATDRPPRG
ncbi:hypothetical protein, partial [Methylobacterium cerastii]|uniref:hypothetical protein n=1 Tax=Methylobacterium cerastii TaxID=932741 RepID=UPI001EE2ADF2